MDRKNNSILVLLLALTIVGGLLASFGIPFLSERTPKISLSDEKGEGTLDPSMGEGGANAGYIPVKVTTDTVQNVIRSLHRQESYYRELTVEIFWQVDGTVDSASTDVKAWTDGGCTMTMEVSQTGAIHHSIVKDGKQYVWDGNDSRWGEFPAEERTGDIAQRVLTYEDVLEFPKEQIVNADYEEKNGKFCILVECAQENVGYLERYWIEVESGLLVAAETQDREDDRLVQRMTETLYEAPISQAVRFTLPDGQVLHEVQAALEAQEDDKP